MPGEKRNEDGTKRGGREIDTWIERGREKEREREGEG